jgi:parallel beta-helix repeat protein
MRLRRKTASLLVSVLLVSLLLSFIPQAAFQGEEQNENIAEFVDTVVAGTPHGPIVIGGDGEFRTIAEAESWPGDGSESDPFIIEDFDIDLGGTDGECIDIQDTSVHFIIRDCSFTGGSVIGGYGIYMWNATNCEVSGNIFYDNYYAMYIFDGNASVVNNEVLSTGSVGFFLSSLENSTISENTITGGQSGLILEGLRWCEINNNTITGSTQISMYLSFCDYLTLSDNDLISGTLAGLYLENSDNCTIIRNTCSDCGDGIFLSYARDNLFKDCTIEGNTNGLYFDVVGTSAWNVIEWCEFRDNLLWGIVVESGTRNLFKWNVFLNNSGPVTCDGSDNIFDYNHYDHYDKPDVDGDKIVDFPLSITGSGGAVDHHPLILFPAYPEWESSPVNQNIEFGEEFSYTLSIMPPIPVGEWYISDILRFVINETGTIKDIDTLDVGTYPIDIVVTNTYGLSLEGSFTVTVADSVSPVWMSLNQDKTFNFGDDVEIQLMAWDLAGIDSWYISDSVNFSVSPTSLVDTGILTIVGIENLAVGTYPLTITAYDPSGNYVTATLTVTVTTPGAGVGGGTEFIVSTAGLGVGILALVVAVFTFLSSRKSPE